MARIATSIEITAPPAHVFAFFIPQRMTSWYGAEISATIEVLGGADEFALGQKVRISGHAPTLRRRAASSESAGRELSLTAVVTVYEWGRVLEWRFRDSFGVSGLQRWELYSLPDAVAPSATRLIFLDFYEMPTRLTRLFDVLFTRHAVRRRDLATLARLRRLIEHQ